MTGLLYGFARSLRSRSRRARLVAELAKLDLERERVFREMCEALERAAVADLIAEKRAAGFDPGVLEARLLGQDLEAARRFYRGRETVALTASTPAPAPVAAPRPFEELEPAARALDVRSAALAAVCFRKGASA